ncbi:NADH oxidase [Firmicutes bacterium ASF500]|nr:NADH oxidase [Firmicutes bacterium ASF500]
MLFQELQIGNTRIRNRIAMTAMATNLADISGGVTQAMIDYYGERAKGGAGLIIIENAGITPNGRNGAVQLRCDVLSNVPGLGRLADAIHYFGAKAIIQLQHAGQATRQEYIGELPVGPSPRVETDGRMTGRALSKLEIEQLVQDFAQAAVYAQQAGLDGVEIHAAHAYLLAEFLSPISNRRQDEYGGSLENRARFAVEVIQAVRKRAGRDFIISVRINGVELDEGGLTAQEAAQAAVLMEKAGADLINVSNGFQRHVDSLSAFLPAGWRSVYAEQVKGAVSVPVLTSGGLRKREMMEDILTSGQADLIGVGRQFIADPHWPEKLKRGCPEAISHCLMCNVGCAGNRITGKRSIQCVVNPDVARESAALFAPRPVKKPRRIAVIGAGPAGLTFACEAAGRGHTVHVWERRPQVNGAMRLAASVPGKGGMEAFCRHMEWLAESGTFTITCGCEAGPEEIMAFSPDAVVYCGGSVPNRLDRVVDYSTGKVKTAHEFLETDRHERSGQRVVVIGGGSVGCEVADRLAEDGNFVTIVEMTARVCGGTHDINRRALLERLDEQGVLILTETSLEGMDGDTVLVKQGGVQRRLEADLILVAAGGRGGPPAWFSQLAERGVDCYAIGEGASARPSNIMQAIQEGTALGRTI